MKFLRKKPTDRTKKFWEEQAMKNLDDVMESICDGWNKKTFDSTPTVFIRYVIDTLKCSKKDKVLDLACGIGRNCKWIAPHVGLYHGVDFINEMISKAIEYNKSIKNAIFYTNDGKTLKDPPEYFDLIFSELAFQHMPKNIQDSYISEVRRTLKPSGIFLVQIPRIDFYHDKSYARHESELPEIFSGFDYSFFESGHEAYFHIKAVKK